MLSCLGSLTWLGLFKFRVVYAAQKDRAWKGDGHASMYGGGCIMPWFNGWEVGLVGPENAVWLQ